MSRIAKLAVVIPNDVDIKISNQIIAIKGNKGELIRNINDAVKIIYKNNTIICNPRDGYADAWAQAGTARAILNSMVIGVTNGFIKKLQLVGIGYRILIKNNAINLFLGFSYSISHRLPAGIAAECPSQSEIIITGADKQVVGQVAADLRSYFRPEPYKGKGLRYYEENVRIKNTKKK